MKNTASKPDEYFLPGDDDGAGWYYQSQLEQQEYEQSDR